MKIVAKPTSYTTSFEDFKTIIFFWECSLNNYGINMCLVPLFPFYYKLFNYSRIKKKILDVSGPECNYSGLHVLSMERPNAKVKNRALLTFL
jgi:hypothetical protein